MVHEDSRDNQRKKLMIENEIRDGANWFYWIAALSIINIFIILFGWNWNFIIGLGITQIVDTYGYELSATLGSFTNYAALFINIMIAGFFILLGYRANKKNKRSFILGMILYAADGLLFLIVLDYLSILFHLIALYFIYKGYIASISDMSKIEVDNDISNDNKLIPE